MLPLDSKLMHLAIALLCGLMINRTEAASGINGSRESQGVAGVNGEQVIREPAFVPLGEVCAGPAAWLGRDVRCQFQLESELATWNPFLTRFGSGDYRALNVWGDEQMLWKREEWEAPLAVLFVRRNGDAAKVFANAPKYARFEVVARVRQVFLGRAWIEIESARRLVPEIGEGALLHASRALQLIAGEQWQLASEDLDRALIGNLPETARTELLRLRDDCKSHTAKRK